MQRTDKQLDQDALYVLGKLIDENGFESIGQMDPMKLIREAYRTGFRMAESEHGEGISVSAIWGIRDGERDLVINYIKEMTIKEHMDVKKDTLRLAIHDIGANLHRAPDV